MSFFERLVSFLSPEQKIQEFRPEPTTPEILACNEFISEFFKSDLQEILISDDEIKSRQNDLLRLIEDIPFGRIRNRFRVLSNLDPVQNRAYERGRVRITFINDEKETTFDLFTGFPSDCTQFRLSKNPDGTASPDGSQPQS